MMASEHITDDQKAHILRMLPLGVDIYTACVQARLTLAQIDFLEDDKEFSRECEFILKQEEIRLITLYHETVDKAAYMKLDYKGLMDRLEFLNPSRFSKKSVESRRSNQEEDESEVIRFQIPSNGRENNDY
jgi:hypothetical protein